MISQHLHDQRGTIRVGVAGRGKHVYFVSHDGWHVIISSRFLADGELLCSLFVN